MIHRKANRSAMATSHEIVPGQAAEGPSGSESAARMFFAVWAQAMGLIVVGGGACGVVFLGVVSTAFLFFTIPGGMCLGAILGLPLGLVLALLFTRYASPPRDPRAFSRQVENVGKSIAMTISVSVNIGVLFDQWSNGKPNALLLGVVANAVFAIYASALVLRECGHVLAAKQLKRFDITSPPRSPLWRHKLGRSATQRSSPAA